MKIIDKIKQEKDSDNIFYSFEYFPPKTQSGIYNLVDRMERMATNLNPLFVDVTWGAGGRTSDSTLFLSSYIQNYLLLDVLMHITCRCQTKDKLDYALEQAKKNNIKNLLVLRGDPPQGMEDYDFTNDPFQYAEDMIKYIKQKYDDYFSIVVAGYPATHIESKDKQEDLYYLKRKVDAGADMIITQLFYDPDEYLDFCKEVNNIGITVPVLPGILPVNNYNSFKKIINLCKISVPKDMIAEIEEIKGDEEKIKEFGIKNAMKMCEKLLQNGVKGFHFYTMNLEKSVTEIVERMGIKRVKQSQKELPWNPRKIPSFRVNNGNTNNNIVNSNNSNNINIISNNNNNTSTNDKDLKQKESVESVRPIFWSNNQRSYISKTFYWDEFPNGKWGDSRSPAFGDNEEHLHTFGDHFKLLNQSKNETVKKMWGGSVVGYQEIANIFISFLEGKINKIPWCEMTEVHDETNTIKDLLLKMNSKCLFTINSQPHVNGEPSTHSMYGWGPANGYVYQRMYVEFFIHKDIMLKLVEKLNDCANLLYQCVDNKGNHYENFKGSVVCALTWGVFPNQEIVQPTIYDSEIFFLWKEEAFEKFDEWAKVYNKEEERNSKEFIMKAKDELFLMTIVDNDYIKPTAMNMILDFLSNV